MTAMCRHVSCAWFTTHVQTKALEASRRLDARETALAERETAARSQESLIDSMRVDVDMRSEVLAKREAAVKEHEAVGAVRLHGRLGDVCY